MDAARGPRPSVAIVRRSGSARRPVRASDAHQIDDIKSTYW